MNFQESGEARTLNLSNAVITKNEQSVTVDALSVDDILVLTLSTDGTAAAVQVLSAQAQVCVCMSLAKGTSRLTESVYETRFFGYCAELESMGANCPGPFWPEEKKEK